MYLYLNPESIIVQGDKEIIIHNLLDSKAYHFTESYSSILKKFVYEKYDYKQVLNEFNKNEVKDLIRFLYKNLLARFLETDDIYIKQFSRTKSINDLIEKNKQFKLDSVIMEITDSCNLDCRFCKEDIIPLRKGCGCYRNKSKKNKRIINENFWINIAKQIVNLGAKNIVFIGGEPFLEKKLLYRLISFFSDKGLRSIVYTNGTILDKEALEICKKNNTGLVIQTVSFQRKLFNHITRSELFDEFIDGIQMIEKYGINTEFMVVENNDNYSSISETIEILQTKKYFIQKSFKNHEQIVNIKNQCDYLISENKINLKNYEMMKNRNACLYGKVFISKNAGIYPCPLIRGVHQLGDLTKDDLYHIFLEEKYKSYWYKSNFDNINCINCYKKLMCINCQALMLNI